MNKFLAILAVLAAGLLAIFLQGSLLRAFLPDFLIPNLIVSIVVLLAFYDNSPYGAVLAFILGLEFDLYGGSPLLTGPSAGALVLVYGVLASLSQRVYVESSFAIFVMALISAMLYSVVYSILIYEFNDSAARYFSLSLSNAVVTGIITPLIFKFFSRSLRVKRSSSHGTHSSGSRQRVGNFKAKNV